jgi:hypothetical protein
MTRRSLAGAALGVMVLVAGCGSPHPAGPPKAATLAAKLGCHVTGHESSQIAAYDVVQYEDASGGPCSTTAIGSQGVIIMTFPSEAKETDWLHQNAAKENATYASGYYEVVSGHLWAIASGGYGAFPTSYVIHKLGGKDTTF